jgi:hypothetical protein
MNTPATREESLALIGKELSRASAAQEVGNIGMVRVCARRAAGIAIRNGLDRNPAKDLGKDSLSQLRAVESDSAIPVAVREAAGRLLIRVDAQLNVPGSTDPIGDCMIIVDLFLGEGNKT